MKLTVSKQIGETKYPFTFEGENLWDVLMQQRHLSFSDLSQCGLCKSNKLFLDAYKTKEQEFKYVVVRCKECQATLTLGQPKSDPNTFYFRRNTEGHYDWTAKPDQAPKPAPQPAQPAQPAPAPQTEQVGDVPW